MDLNLTFFTFIPEWVFQDVIILIATFMTIVFIIKNEEHPEIILFEMFCFCVFYAGVYENFATMIGHYAYGRSIIMFFNVPLTIPLVEYLVVYASLRMTSHMDIPTWGKPIVAGLMGILFDLPLDPLVTRQVFSTAEGVVGRWSWYLGMDGATILGVPVLNFTGWFLLSAYGSMFLILGRRWYEKSNFRSRVGYGYPMLTMFAALVLLVTPPVTMFILWLDPILPIESFGSWITFGTSFVVSGIFLAQVWKGKMKSEFSVKSEYPLFLMLIGFHAVNLFFAVIGGFYEILWLQIMVGSIQAGFVFLVYRQGKLTRVTELAPTLVQLSAKNLDIPRVQSPRSKLPPRREQKKLSSEDSEKKTEEPVRKL